MMPLFELPLHILLCWAVVYGVYACCQPGMIFDLLLQKAGIDIWWFDAGWRDYVEIPHWTKPLYSCPVCMSGIWGIAYAVFMETTKIGGGWTILHILPLCLGVAGINYLIVQGTNE